MARPCTPEARLDLWSALAVWAERTPGAPAVQSGEVVRGFAELADSARRFASRLAGLSGPAERPVAVEGPLAIDGLAAALGAIASGRPAVWVDADLPPGQREQLLAATGAASLDELEDGGGAEGGDRPGPLAPGATLLLGLADGRVVPVLQEDLTRGAVWLSELGVGPGDRVAAVLPLAYPLTTLDLLAPIALGATLILPPRRLPPRDAIGWLASERVTALHLLPSWAQVWANRARGQRVPSLRHLWFSGEPLPDAVVRRWRAIGAGSLAVASAFGSPLVPGHGRAELIELEAALAEIPGVDAAVVVAAESGLTAYVAVRPDAGDWRERGRAVAARAGLTLALVELERMPRLPAGPIDRDGLGRLAAEPAAPQDATEVAVAAAWQEVLGIQVGRDDDFFMSGGQSLLAAQLAARLAASFALEIPLGVVLEAPTIAAQAAWIDRTRSGRRDAGAPVRRQRRPALSYVQERQWFFEELSPGTTVNHLQRTFVFDGELRRDALDFALDTIGARHESLRTVFRREGQLPVQEILPAMPREHREEDLAALGDRARKAALRKGAAEFRRAFDLARGPLWRTVLYSLSPTSHVLVVTMHHIISDAYSLNLWVRELAECYAAFTDGRPPVLPELRAGPADLAEATRRAIADGTLDAARAYWKRRLTGIAGLDVPTDRPRPSAPSYRGVFVPLHVPADQVQALRRLAADTGCTLFMLLLGALDILLARLAGQSDVVVGTIVAGRDRPESRDLIGLFLNNVPIRVDLAGDPSYRSLLERVREATRGALGHAHVPFERILADLSIPREPGRHPIFDVLLNLAPPPDSLALPSLRVSPFMARNDAAPVDLLVTLREEPSGAISGNLRCASDLYELATANRLASRFTTVLAAVLADPDLPLSRVPLLGDDERRILVGEWSGTDGPPAPDLVAAIAASAAAGPDETAFFWDGGRLSRAELDALSNRIGHLLRRRGLARGEPVAVLLRRGPHLPAALVGVLKAGGAFALLDPLLPPARIASMLAVGGVRAVLTESALAPAAAGAEAIQLDDPATLAQGSPEPLDVPLGPDDLAYVMFTSGSTGVPKGVAVPHRGLANRIEWVRTLFPFAPGEVACQKTALGFIDAIWELLGPLRDGVPCLLPAEETVLDPVALTRALAQHRVTRLMLVPSLLRQLLRAHWGRRGWLPDLALWQVGGEDLSADLAREFLEARPDARLVNLYGLSEVSGEATWHPVSPAESGRVPIGVPGPNVRTYVVDAAGEPAPAGTWGELCIGGAGVARGYLGLPEATRERFQPDPFRPGATLFRTGDRARWRHDGVIEYAGRLDEQIKIRGVRVEPAEIEAALRRHPEIADVAVLARPGRDGETRLVAYLVPTDRAAPPRPALLRSHLRGALPEVMIPSSFLALGELPLGPSGKLDRAVLPEPTETRAEDTAPRTATETALAEVWRELLGGAPPGVDDDFFASGGYSLLVAELAARVRAAFVVDLPLVVFFQSPTIAEQARRIDEARRASMEAAGDEGGVGARPTPVERAARMPLSFAQERLWLGEASHPGARPHVVSTGLRLRGPIDLDRLEAAIDRVAARHELLRTTFSAEMGVPYQTAHAELPRDHERIDLAEEDEETRAAEIRRLQEEEYARPFALEKGPPWRTVLIRLADDEHVLLCTMAHLVSDGWSMRRWVDDVNAYLTAEPGEDPLPPLEIQPADVAVWQRRRIAEGAQDTDRAYWRQLLGDSRPSAPLPADGPRHHEGAAWLHARLDRALTAELRRQARAESATTFMVALAALSRLLAEETRDPVATVGALVAGRDLPEIQPLIAPVLNTVPMRIDTAGAIDFRDLLRRTRDSARAALAHGAVPFERIVADLNPPREPGRNPIFDVAINYLPPAEEWRLADLAIESLDPPRSIPAPFEVMWRFIERGGGLHLRIEYRAGRFREPRVAAWRDRFLAILTEAAGTPRPTEKRPGPR